MTDRRKPSFLLIAALLLAASGCGSQNSAKVAAPSAPAKDTAAVASDSGASSSAPAAPVTPAAPAAETQPAEPPFNPPTLEELDKTAQWEDRPVHDSLKLLREDLAKSKSLVSVAEALKLRNNSQEDNEKILSALGRLP